jgi:catechol 2,3-dioxygenase-like lactoylglutathione lyase family enzyme
MLRNAKVATRLPAKDLNRARAFYSEKLGLEPVEQREGGLRYACAAGEFAIFVSAGMQSGTHTQMGWEVEDIEVTLRELRARGVEFEEYDLPGSGSWVAWAWAAMCPRGEVENPVHGHEQRPFCSHASYPFYLAHSALGSQDRHDR